MRHYITTGTILLLLSMACEEKKQARRVEAPPTTNEVVLSSPVAIALPSVNSESTEKETAATPQPTLTMAAKVLPSPVQYEDVANRVLAEGSRDEAKDESLAKIREKALLRLKAMQAKAKTQAEKSDAQDQETADTPKEEAPMESQELESKVAMVDAEGLRASEAQVLGEAAKDPMEGDEAAVISSRKIDAKTAKMLEIQFRKARDLAKAGKVEAAKNIFLSVCQAGHAHACHKFAWYEEQAGNSQNATRFYRAACDNGLGKSCNNLAFQFEQKKIYDKALEFYARGCMEKHEAACTSLKRIHEEQLQDDLKTR